MKSRKPSRPPKSTTQLLSIFQVHFLLHPKSFSIYLISFASRKKNKLFLNGDFSMVDAYRFFGGSRIIKSLSQIWLQIWVINICDKASSVIGPRGRWNFQLLMCHESSRDRLFKDTSNHFNFAAVLAPALWRLSSFFFLFKSHHNLECKQGWYDLTCDKRDVSY